MMNFFGFNCTFPFGMNNWFMPNLPFTNFWGMFSMPSFNIFDSWMNQCVLNYNPFTYNMQLPSSFSMNFSVFDTIDTKKLSNNSHVQQTNNVDTFTKTSNVDYSKDKLKPDGYNASKGNRLANAALSRSVGWTGYCAAYVKRAIQSANLGSYKSGHAYQMSDILRNNSNFKEISTDGVDVSKLPAGCVLVYDRGTQGYSKKYGHTEITTGDGRAVSDGITRHLRKKPSAIFIPV